MEEAFQLIQDIFSLDLDKDGYVSKKEFLIVTSQSKPLTTILCATADIEKKKKSGQKSRKISTSEVIQEPKEDQNKKHKKKSKKSKKKRKNEQSDQKDIFQGSLAAPGLTSLKSRRRSIY